jgi:hypothetical protein
MGRVPHPLWLLVGSSGRGLGFNLQARFLVGATPPGFLPGRENGHAALKMDEQPMKLTKKYAEGVRYNKRGGGREGGTGRG